jgi:putative PEP-CTERM system histidine kinase
MENYSFYSYLTATIAYILLLPLLLSRIKTNPQAPSFIVATLFSIGWAGYTTLAIENNELFTSEILSFETIRNAAWFLLLSTLISQQLYNSNYAILAKSKLAVVLIVATLFIFTLEVYADFRYALQQFFGQDIRLFAHVAFSIIGLVLVEQTYRNTTLEQRWNIKFICLGLGALFIVDFIVYSKSLLFAKLDSSLWNSRGFLNALVVPLLAVSSFRLQVNEASKVTVSRKLVFHTTILFGTGLYLIMMSLAGFYIRDFGGNWGEVAQIFFIFLALLLLFALFASGKVRALAKVYFNKHFFHYRYDYRDEWIKLSKTIAQLGSISELSGFIIKTMAKLVDSSGGGLWLKNEQGSFYLAEESNLGFNAPQIVNANDSLIKFLTEKQWVIDFVEFFNAPEIYSDVDLLPWYKQTKSVWLIIPLFRQNELEAFVVLTQSIVPRKLNWEDHDLLKTVGMQLTNALALSHASDALSRSRQFEAYNRLSAYLVHDMKNLVAQISLIVRNSTKHKHNPAFIDDSIETLENVVDKIEYLLAQLKKGTSNNDIKTIINLADIIGDVVIQQAGNKPPLQIEISQEKIDVFGEKEKMAAILGHLVQNAQDATEENGMVKLVLNKNDSHAIIKIIDNGCGMDTKFISERLFKPFDTTKGNAGMGIGVYEARDYILKHSGQIDVESCPGEGSTFIISLPLISE